MTTSNNNHLPPPEIIVYEGMGETNANKEKTASRQQHQQKQKQQSTGLASSFFMCGQAHATAAVVLQSSSLGDDYFFEHDQDQNSLIERGEQQQEGQTIQAQAAEARDDVAVETCDGKNSMQASSASTRLANSANSTRENAPTVTPSAAATATTNGTSSTNLPNTSTTKNSTTSSGKQTRTSTGTYLEQFVKKRNAAAAAVAAAAAAAESAPTTVTATATDLDSILRRRRTPTRGSSSQTSSFFTETEHQAKGDEEEELKATDNNNERQLQNEEELMVTDNRNERQLQDEEELMVMVNNNDTTSAENNVANMSCPSSAAGLLLRKGTVTKTSKVEMVVHHPPQQPKTPSLADEIVDEPESTDQPTPAVSPTAAPPSAAVPTVVKQAKADETLPVQATVPPPPPPPLPSDVPPFEVHVRRSIPPTVQQQPNNLPVKCHGTKNGTDNNGTQGSGKHPTAAASQQQQEDEEEQSKTKRVHRSHRITIETRRYRNSKAGKLIDNTLRTFSTGSGTYDPNNEQQQNAVVTPKISTRPGKFWFCNAAPSDEVDPARSRSLTGVSTKKTNSINSSISNSTDQSSSVDEVEAIEQIWHAAAEIVEAPSDEVDRVMLMVGTGDMVPVKTEEAFLASVCAPTLRSRVVSNMGAEADDEAEDTDIEFARRLRTPRWRNTRRRYRGGSGGGGQSQTTVESDDVEEEQCSAWTDCCCPGTVAAHDVRQVSEDAKASDTILSAATSSIGD